MKKIRNKIVIPITVLIIIFISVLVVFFNHLIKDIYMNVITREMDEKTEVVNIVLKESHGLYTGRISHGLSEEIRLLSGIVNMRITVLDLDGNVVADSEHDPSTMDNHRYRTEIKDAIEKKAGQSIRYSNTINADMLYFAKKMDRYVIRLSKPLHEADEALWAFNKMVFLAGFIVIILSIGVILFISLKITAPIRETRNFALNFSGGDYSSRIPDFSDDEIGVLQKSLNRMADNIVAKMNLLAAEQNKLRVTFESISDGIALIEKNKQIAIANMAFCSLLGISTDVINRIYYEVIRGSSLNKKIEKALSGGERANFQEKLLTDRYCEVFLVPVKEVKSTGLLIIVHDITEKKKMDQLKTDLVGNMSHELKTPIAILRGYLETIQMNLDDPEMCEDFLTKALLNLERQNSIISDMLKLNMLETMTEIPIEKINLREIILNCVEILKSRAAAKYIEVAADIDVLDKQIDGNRFLAEEIFFNIISNAINYNNLRGLVSIYAGEKGGKTVVSVADTGIGIPHESLGRVFERFYRVDKSRSRATGGTGLGLSIVKHAVEMLNWNIDVESNEDGTRFDVIIG